MRFSNLFTQTLKDISKDETSTNARLLTRGSFIYKNSAGVYTFLPLGWRVVERVTAIIREEMNKIGGVELFMPALVERKYLDATGRFGVDIGFDVYGKGDKKPTYALGWTHEEVLTEIASHYVSSYKDLPFAAYQIQTKFRNEPRAKSGLLRGREFLMKDLYSFHKDEKDLQSYYDKVKKAYFNIFERVGLKTYYTLAAGGDFTTGNTHEFQVLADVGEDTIFYCNKCEYAENAEISKLKEGNKCSKCEGKLQKSNAIEVGNIFPLGTKYSESFNLIYSDKKGKKYPVIMGSYGIGIGRLIGTVAELYHDEEGIVWPDSIAPYDVHLMVLENPETRIKNQAEQLYQQLSDKGASVLFDDREDVSAGAKFADADLLGIPTRAVMSEKSFKAGGVEIKKRDEAKGKIVNVDAFIKSI